MRKPQEILQLVPKQPDWRIDWSAAEQSALAPYIDSMRKTQQNPVWHGEGDVWIHTRMVCEELAARTEFRNLERRKQEEVFLAALLHDIGKIPCTRLEDGRWTSPNHTAVGARMAREFLWKEYGFCGTEELQQFRETVCTLIRYHSVPPHILDQKRPEHRLIRIAASAELVPDFSLELLCLLVKADMCGRCSTTLSESLERLELCTALAEEAGCMCSPLRFPDVYSEYAYLSGRNIFPGQQLFDDTWGEVIVMAGLPGTGKDTWISEHYREYPMISLDELRREMKISPAKPQGAVVNAARELAKEYLRRKEPFIWNATSLTPMIRERQIQLFAGYHASVKIVYLETEWEEQMRRNGNRKETVPEQVIEEMLGSLVLPERFEAHRIEWHCV